jgi:excisionase family DNA binding protein
MLLAGNIMEKMLTVGEVSAALQVHAETVRAWLRVGKLRGTKLGPRSWRVPQSAIDEMLRQGAADERP